MDWTQIIPIGLQLPLVFIVIWYTDKMLKDFRAEREVINKARDDERKEAILERERREKEAILERERMNALHREERKEFLSALKQNTDTLEDFLKEVRNGKR